MTPRCRQAAPRLRARSARLLAGRWPLPAGLRAQRGQAAVELLGALPALFVLGVVLFQLLAVGYAAVLAGTAAEAGALAVAGGADPRDSARNALPGWSRAGARVRVRGGDVTVHLRPPALLGRLSRALEVSSTASVVRR